MRRDVQVVVDRLAQELGRSVTLCDADDDPVTFSDLSGPVDEHRRAWVLSRGRASRDDVRQIARTHPGPLVRLEAGHFGPGSLARVFGLVRDAGGPLGGLCVIDDLPPLTPDQLALVEAAAGGLAVLMRREHDAEERRLEEHTDLVRALLGDGPAERREAARALADRDVLSRLAPCTVVVVSLCGDASGEALHEARRALRESLHHARLRHGTRRCLAALLHGRGVLLLLGSGPDDDADQAARKLHDQLSDRLRTLPEPSSAVVAVSDPQPGIEQAHLAHAQALRVGRVAVALGEVDTVVSSAVVGVYDVLGRMPRSALSREVLPEGLLRLIDRPGDGGTLIRTLECYLDHAGNAGAAAQQLFVHRGTLYYRLERIEEITGVELRDGVQRLSLHLGIKLARLAGLVR